MKEKIKIPNEPVELKERMQNWEYQGSSNPDIYWDSFVVWAGNQLPKYLWREWKEDLVTVGFTWQRFLKLLKFRTDKAILWFRDSLSWDEFIKEIISLINSPIRDRVIKNKK